MITYFTLLDKLGVNPVVEATKVQEVLLLLVLLLHHSLTGNIACYHALLLSAKPQEENRLVEEIRVALAEAVKNNPAFKETFRKDEDFSELLKRHPNFPD